MTEALIVLNPRHIPECIAAIQELALPTCWLSYMCEEDAATAANLVIGSTGFDRYILLSDDTTPTRDALDLILRAADEGHPAVTGYCNLDENEHRGTVNLTTNQLPPPPPEIASYKLMARATVEQHPEPTISTTFAGLSLTLLTRDLWLEHPLQTTSAGGQMDYDLSYRLARSGVPIVAPVGAYVHHVKERWNCADQNPEKRLLVGAYPPQIHWTGL